VQTVVAMALDLPIDLVEREAGTRESMDIDDTITLLRKFDLQCRPVGARMVADWWSVFYKQGGGRGLRGLGCLMPKGRNETGHAYLLVGRRMYDPASARMLPLNADTVRQLDWVVFFPSDAPRGAGVVEARRRHAGMRRAALRRADQDQPVPASSTAERAITP
jgi:hypothetical protein